MTFWYLLLAFLSQVKANDLQGTRVLLIGGSGLKGPYFAAQLMHRGANVTILSRAREDDELGEFKSMNLQTLQQIGAGVIKADLFRDLPSPTTGKRTESTGDETEELERIFREHNFDIVIDLILTKLESFERMVKALRTDDGNGWRIKQYIWASTVEAYGMCEDQSRRIFGKKKKMEITEDDWSPESCQPAEHVNKGSNSILVAWDKIHRQSVKLWNEEKFPYTYLFAPPGELLYTFSQQMGEPQIWHGELQLMVSAPVTKPIHVYPVAPTRIAVTIDDFATAIAAAIVKREAAIGHHFHITMDEALSLKEYIEAVAKATGKDQFPVDESGKFTGGLHRQAVVRKWGILSNAKAKKLLGWSPKPIDVWMKQICDSFAPHLQGFFDHAYMPQKKMKAPSVDESFPREVGKFWSGVKHADL